MDALYSLCLVGAIAGVVVASLLALARRTNVAFGTAAGSFGLVLASTLIHVAFGHRPGTTAALLPGPFLREHPALALVGAICLGLLYVSKRSR